MLGLHKRLKYQHSGVSSGGLLQGRSLSFSEAFAKESCTSTLSYGQYCHMKIRHSVVGDGPEKAMLKRTVMEGLSILKQT